MMKTRFKALPLAIGALLAVPTVPSSTVVAATLEEVIVTARKREENVQDTPVSITAVLADTLEKRGVGDFTQLGNNNPNVKITQGNAGSAVSTTVAIRGNVQNDPGFNLDSAVGTYIDGMIVSRTYGTTGSMVDLESMQTLKGPQGSLFGRNTTGGAVLMTTKSPELGAVNGYIKGEAGQLDTAGLTAAINIPLGDSVAVRLVGSHTERNGYQHMADGSDYGDQNMSMFRAKVLWEIDDATTLLFMAERVDMDATSTVNVLTQPNHPQYNNVSTIAGVYNLGPLGVITTPLHATDEKNTADVNTYNLNLTHEMGWGEIKFLAGQRKLDVGVNLTLPPGLGFTNQDKPGNDQKSAELQVNGSFFDDKLDVTSGLYYFKEETHERQNTQAYAGVVRAIFSPSGAPVSLANMDTDVDSKSLFGQATYHLTDATNLTLGGRFTKDKRESTGTYQSRGGPIANLSWDDDRSKFNYLVSLDHKFTQDIMGYGNVSTGYRSAGANVAPNANVPGQWASFSPEELTNYELGLKSDWLDGALRVNGAVFYQDYSDYQYTQVLLVNGIPTRNAVTTDAELKGGELEVTMALPWDITFSTTYGYVHAIETAQDRYLPNVPKNNFGATLSKRITLAIGDVDLTANYDWRDDFFSALDFPHESHVDDVGLLNLSASLTTEHWQTVAYVNNATDERYYVNMQYSPGLAAAGGLSGLSFAPLGVPRVAGVKVTYNF
jgi:iron complex outermembrane receptor protein